MFLHVEEKRLEISNFLHSVTTLLRLLTTEKPAIIFLVLPRKHKKFAEEKERWRQKQEQNVCV